MDSAKTPIKFEIYQGGQLQRTEVLAEKTIKIGKLTTSHLRLDDESVARVHAMIEVQDERTVLLVDLGSAGGTFVNGERVTSKRAIKSGDQLAFGNVKVVMTIAGQPGRKKSPNERKTVNAPLFDEEVDPRNPNARTLEILTLWESTVLDVQHYSSAHDFVVGEVPEQLMKTSQGKKLAKQIDQFIDASFLPQTPFTLAVTDGRQMAVHVPDKIAGEVMSDGKVETIDELRSSGRMGESRNGSRTLKMLPNTRCRLHFGNITLLVNSVPPPPPMGQTSFLKSLDLTFFKYLCIAILMHALFFGIVLSVPKEADSLKIDGFNLNDRFVEFLVIPEEELREKSQKLTDLLNELEKEPEPEVAAAAKGEEGKMGKKDAPDTGKRAGIAGPANNQEIQFAKQQMKTAAIASASAAVANIEGQLSAIWGSGDRTIGSDAVNAFGNMFGNQIGESGGFGGLGMAGSGFGGGGLGTNSIGIGAIGTHGRGGSGTGTGYGNTQLKHKTGSGPKFVPGKPTVQGSLSPDQIRRVVQKHANATRNCYNKELQQKRDLAGKIVVKFTIGPNGKVLRVEIPESTMKNANVEQCLRTQVKSWQFPEPKGGGSVTVNYPFTFTAE